MPDFSRFRNYILALDAILYALCLLGVYHVALKADIPAVFTNQNSYLIVTEVSHPRIGLAPGDTIVSVGGSILSTPEDVEFYTDGHAIGEVASFVIQKNGNAERLEIPLIPFYSANYILIILLVGSLHFFFGVFVLLKKFQDEVAHVFHWLIICLAIIIMPTWGYYLVPPQGLGHALRILFSLGYAFLPTLFIHFTFIFPRRKALSIRQILRPFYVFSLMLAIWMSAAFLMAAFKNSVPWFHIYMRGFDICRLFFSAGIVASVVNFIHSYYHAAEELERRKLRWVLGGLIVAPITFVAFWQIPMVITSHALMPEEYVLLISSAIPVTFSISIVQYHIMNIDLIFNRSTVYLFVAGILLSIYVFIVGMIAALVGTFTVATSVVASAAAAVVVALLFEPARRRVQKFVDKRFFRVQYNFRTAQRIFIEEIRHCPLLTSLADLMINRIHELIPVERIGFVSVSTSTNPFQLLAHSDDPSWAGQEFSTELPKLQFIDPVPVGMKDKIEPGAVFSAADPEMLRRLNAVLIIPVMSNKNDLSGFLVLGQKKSGARFGLEDMDLLNTVATQAGLSIERINLQQDLISEHSETQRLEELNRLKSYFVSSVSHDLKTPLTSIHMFAEILDVNKNLSKKRTQEYLAIITGETERLTRLINNVLNYSRMERGVREYSFSRVELNDLCRSVLRSLEYQFKIQKFKVRVHLSKGKYFIHADADAIADAFMNLISNAMKYSLAKKEISVGTFRKGDSYAIEVADKGMGIATDELQKIFNAFYRAEDEKVQKLGGLGLGLTLVDHAMKAHNGKIEVASAPERGTKFALLFPTGGKP